MGRLDRQLYNQKEFKAADRLERIRIHLIAGARGNYALTEAEEEYLGYMEQAWSILQTERSQVEAVKLLRWKVDGMRQFPATQIMRDAITLFGDFVEIHRPTQRGMIRENLLKCIEECETAYAKCLKKEPSQLDLQGWMKQKAGYWKLLMELDQITSIEDAIAADTTIPEISFTTDPAALMVTEDTTYTEE